MVLGHFHVSVLVSRYMIIVGKKEKEAGLSIGRLLDDILF